MNIKPMHDRLIVKRISEEETTSSGLIIASEDRSVNTFQGVVIAVGEGYQMTDGIRPLDVEVGQTVLFGGQVTSIKDEEGTKDLFIMKESNILGIIEK